MQDITGRIAHPDGRPGRRGLNDIRTDYLAAWSMADSLLASIVSAFLPCLLSSSIPKTVCSCAGLCWLENTRRWRAGPAGGACIQHISERTRGS